MTPLAARTFQTRPPNEGGGGSSFFLTSSFSFPAPLPEESDSTRAAAVDVESSGGVGPEEDKEGARVKRGRRWRGGALASEGSRRGEGEEAEEEEGTSIEGGGGWRAVLSCEESGSDTARGIVDGSRFFL